MTRDEQIERAAASMAAANCTVYMGRPSKFFMDMATAALDALVPPGEAWIAPWEATTVMGAAWNDTGEFASYRKDWAAMRDAYLAEQPDKPT